MPARFLDGLAIAAEIRASLRPRITAFTVRAGRPPGLAIVLVGQHPASEIYVRNKTRAAAEIGVRADLLRLDRSSTLEDMLALIERLNESDEHDGLLVQTPLPIEIGEEAPARVFDVIDPAKDVDGFSPVNVGRLVQKRATVAPCTPSGIIEILNRSAIPIAGARAVVLGRSEIVGKPTALMLLQRDATVTICHSKTPDLPETAAAADILVAAIGRPAFVTRQFVKPGAAVIDVGINRLNDGGAVSALFEAGSPRRQQFERRGSIVVGDVHPEVEAVAGALSPVPGGVGPLTVAMLLSNTVRLAERRIEGR